MKFNNFFFYINWTVELFRIWSRFFLRFTVGDDSTIFILESSIYFDLVIFNGIQSTLPYML